VFFLSSEEGVMGDEVVGVEHFFFLELLCSGESPIDSADAWETCDSFVLCF
jgi:hypothetical protein